MGVINFSNNYNNNNNNNIVRIALLFLPVTITGNLNIHIEQPDDAYLCWLVELLTDIWLVQCTESPTHDADGLLGIVIIMPEQAPENVAIVDTGLSDQVLVTLSLNHTAPASVYVKSTRRTWRNFSFSEFTFWLQMT